MKERMGKREGETGRELTSVLHRIAKYKYLIQGGRTQCEAFWPHRVYVTLHVQEYPCLVTRQESLITTILICLYRN